MAGLLKIAAVAVAGFHRCGLFWPHEGRVIDVSLLEEDVLERLKAEPQLHISPASEDEAEAAQADLLRDQIKEAFAALEAPDFTEDGTPKTDAVKKALPKGTRGVTAALVAEIWGTVVPSEKPAN